MGALQQLRMSWEIGQPVQNYRADIGSLVHFTPVEPWTFSCSAGDLRQQMSSTRLAGEPLSAGETHAHAVKRLEIDCAVSIRGYTGIWQDT